MPLNLRTPITKSDIEAANNRIKRIESGVITTPLHHSTALSTQTGVTVLLKCEHLQNTGSFKLRGALNKLSRLAEEQDAREVIASSSGNHGLATALSASILGFKATIYVPETASPMKVNAIEALGAQVIKIPGEPLLAEIAAREASEASNIILVSPYNDLDVVTGQGTIALELLQQCPDLDGVLVSVGGGGLISGIGTYMKAVNPSVEVIGAWPKIACTLHDCLEAGEIISVDEEPTLSDGTAGGVEEGAVTFPIAQKVIDTKILVSEQDIASAMRLIADTERWIIEGAAGVAVAALIQEASRYQGKKIAVVLCGRNIALEKYLSAVA